MYSLGIILITGLGSLLRVSYMNNSERYVRVRKGETFLKIAPYSCLRISTAPYSAESEINSSEKYVFYSC